MIKLKIAAYLILSVLFTQNPNNNNSITVMDAPSVKFDISETKQIAINFQDTLKGDTLFLNYSESGLPVSYHRDIVSGICVDNECRPVRLSLYWDITGRYLGFKLPKGEFLSKTKHVEFTLEEYKKLHELLKDPHSLLANYTVGELAPIKDMPEEKTDAVSSATISDISDYIVKGAVFTTYTLWHIVYGVTHREILKKTKEVITPELVLSVLNSGFTNDKIWALNHITPKFELKDSDLEKILGFIQKDNFYLAERALNSIPRNVISDENIQAELLEKFKISKFALQRLIIQKFIEAPYLSENVVSSISNNIQSYNASLLNYILKLYEAHNIQDEKTCLEVAGLLSSNNSYVSRKAYNYLSRIPVLDKKVEKQIDKYRSKNKI